MLYLLMGVLIMMVLITALIISVRLEQPSEDETPAAQTRKRRARKHGLTGGGTHLSVDRSSGVPTTPSASPADDDIDYGHYGGGSVSSGGD